MRQLFSISLKRIGYSQEASRFWRGFPVGFRKRKCSKRKGSDVCEAYVESGLTVEAGFEVFFLVECPLRTETLFLYDTLFGATRNLQQVPISGGGGWGGNLI